MAPPTRRESMSATRRGTRLWSPRLAVVMPSDRIAMAMYAHGSSRAGSFARKSESRAVSSSAWAVMMPRSDRKATAASRRSSFRIPSRRVSTRASVAGARGPAAPGRGGSWSLTAAVRGSPCERAAGCARFSALGVGPAELIRRCRAAERAARAPRPGAAADLHGIAVGSIVARDGDTPASRTCER